MSTTEFRENVFQIRELYQSMQDARQNKIMVVITIITTIFLPLTLITGWYGMNFVLFVVNNSNDIF